MTVTVKKDGRTILTGKHYTKLREQVFLRDKGRCTSCDRHVGLMPCGADSDMHLHHKHGRGIGGGRRDDVLSECEALCAACHRKEHNQ